MLARKIEFSSALHPFIDVSDYCSARPLAHRRSSDSLSTKTSDGISLLGPRRTMVQICEPTVRVRPLAGSAGGYGCKIDRRPFACVTRWKPGKPRQLDC